MRLHERLGLCVPPDLIQVAVLGPEMRPVAGGLRHFAASVEDLNALGLRPRTVVILENKETGYAITGDLAGTGLLLEQERIPWAHANQQLTHTIGTPASPGQGHVHNVKSARRMIRSVVAYWRVQII